MQIMHQAWEQYARGAILLIIVFNIFQLFKGDEPLYIKQLKQLRWGHFRQIQREMRRLEDLEKFLDSCECNINDI